MGDDLVKEPGERELGSSDDVAISQRLQGRAYDDDRGNAFEGYALHLNVPDLGEGDALTHEEPSEG